jgi:hypothetical protein
VVVVRQVHPEEKDMKSFIYAQWSKWSYGNPVGDLITQYPLVAFLVIVLIVIAYYALSCHKDEA